MSQTGQTHFKNLAASVSDHSGTLCSKWLIYSYKFSNDFREHRSESIHSNSRDIRREIY